MRNRWHAVLAILAVLSLAIAACAAEEEEPAADPGEEDQAPGPDEGEPDDEDLSVVRVGYIPVESFAPLMLTAELFAEEEGLQIEMQEFPSGAEILTGVTTGSLEVGGAGIGAASYNAFEEGLPFRMVAPQHGGYVEDYFTLSSSVAASQEEASALAEDLSGLAGEAFTVNAPGVVTDWLLGAALERGGLEYDDVEIEHMPFPDMVPALASGAVVGGIVSEPFPSRAEAEDAGYRPWDSPADQDPLPFTVVIYNTDWAEQNPEAAEAFMRAFHRTAQMLDERGWKDDEVLEVIAEWTGLEADGLRDTRSHALPVELDIDLDQMRAYQEFFMDIGAVTYDEPIDDSELWDFRWRDAALEAG